jgi:antitoxin component YwqK of YwqJK toxin-antitoxin module
MDKILKIKTQIAFLMFFLFSVSQSNAQNISAFSKLKERDNKLYLGDQIFSGLVVKTFITNQPKSISEVKGGLTNGKVIDFIEELSFVSKAYRDTAEINRLNIQISIKKQELEQALQDTVKASKEQNDFLNYEIGGNEKLLKLKEKDAEGKLNKNKKEIYDKYEQYDQTNKQCTRRFQDIQLQINNLNQQIKSENDKPIYIPKKSMEYLIINGLKEGKAIIYDSLGNKFGEGEYLNDKQNGLWTYYYPNGSKLAQGNFISGDGGNKGKSGVPKNGRDGQWILYHKNGKTDQDAIYKNGMINGYFKKYYDSGQIKQECFYNSDKINGLMTLFYENGKLKQESNYKNGEKTGIEVLYNEKGIKDVEYYLTNNIKDGIQKQYHLNGILKGESYFKNGKLNGKIKNFFENGNLKSELQMCNDKKQGDFVEYFENGKIKFKFKMDTTSLAEGNIIGDFFEYNEDGTVKSHIYAYKDGRLEDKVKSEVGYNSVEVKKQYKCKCCKNNINGLLEGVDDKGNECTELDLQLYEQLNDSSMGLLGYNNKYDYMRGGVYKYCTMKCARTCH